MLPNDSDMNLVSTSSWYKGAITAEQDDAYKVSHKDNIDMSYQLPQTDTAQITKTSVCKLRLTPTFHWQPGEFFQASLCQAL